MIYFKVFIPGKYRLENELGQQSTPISALGTNEIQANMDPEILLFENEQEIRGRVSGSFWVGNGFHEVLVKNIYLMIAFM